VLLLVSSRYFQKVCQHRGKVGAVTKTLLNIVKSHIGTENNMVVTSHFVAALLNSTNSIKL